MPDQVRHDGVKLSNCQVNMFKIPGINISDLDNIGSPGQKALGMELDLNRNGGFGRPHDEVFDISDEELDTVLNFG